MDGRNDQDGAAELVSRADDDAVRAATFAAMVSCDALTYALANSADFIMRIRKASAAYHHLSDGRIAAALRETLEMQRDSAMRLREELYRRGNLPTPN